MNTKTVILVKPIERNGEKITQITITDAIKQAGSLRGLKLINILNMDVDSVAQLLTRITSPRLKSTDIDMMETQDFIALSEALVPFLTPGSSGTQNEMEMDNA